MTGKATDVPLRADDPADSDWDPLSVPSELLTNDTFSLRSRRSQVEPHRDAGNFPQAKRNADELPLVLGEYEILAEVGRGGMGIVYKARHCKLQRIVALKVMLGRETLSPDRSDRFKIEAEAIAKLDHPNIVPIYEIGESDGRQYFAMAFIEGRSLAHAVAPGPLPPRRAAEVIHSLALAIAHAHSQGVVHRDLKPENILLDITGRPRITDFGIAKFMHEDTRLTQAGQVIGTPSYMPPEQAQGDTRRVGPSADVYSLGATLYCLLTGRPPFQAATALDSLKQVIEREPVSPRQLNPVVDRDLETICLKCLEKRPEKRYSSAAALADDLQCFLEKKPIRARPVGVLQRAVRWCWRNPLDAALAASMVAVFVAAFVLITLSYWREARQRGIADREREQASQARESERWERFRANMGTVGSAVQSQNFAVAKRALEAAPAELRNWEWWHFHQLLDGSQRVIGGQKGGMARALFLDNERVLTNDQGLIRLWNKADGRLLRSLNNARCGEFWPISVSPDRRLLAYLTNDRDIQIWNLMQDRQQCILAGIDKSNKGFEFNQDSTKLFSRYADGWIRIWDVARGRRLNEWRLFEKPVEDVRVTLGHRILAAKIDAEPTMHIYDLETGQEKCALEGPTMTVNQTCFNPLEDRVVTSERYPSTNMQLWDTATGRHIATLSGHTNQIHGIQYSPDGSRIASICFDQTVGLWDGRSGNLIGILKKHNGRVNSATFSSDSTRLASTSEDQTVRLWDAANGASIAVLRGHTKDVYSASFSPDGATIVSGGGDDSARLWNVLLATRDGVLRGHTSYVYDVAFHPDGERVVSVAWDGTLRIWDATSGMEKACYSHGRDVIVAGVAVHPAGKMLATIARNDSVHLVDCDTAKLLHQWKVPTHFWRDGRLKFSPSGDLLAASSSDGSVYLLDVEKRGEFATLETEPREPVIDVAFDPRERWLAAALGDNANTVRIWDLQSRLPVCDLHGHTDSLRSLAVSADGKLLGSASADGTVRLWDTKCWTEAAVLKHDSGVYGLSFHPAGTRLATACADNSIRLWDLARCQEVVELRGHSSYVHAVAFSPDGSRLASASGDATLRTWDSISAEHRAERAAGTTSKP